MFIKKKKENIWKEKIYITYYLIIFYTWLLSIIEPLVLSCFCHIVEFFLSQLSLMQLL